MIPWKYMHLDVGSYGCTNTMLRSRRNHHVMYQSSMAKQALVTYHHTMLKVIIQQELWIMFKDPLVTTQIAEMNRFNDFPNGLNAMVAVAIYTGLIKKIRYFKQGVYRQRYVSRCHYKTIIVEERKIGVNEKICMPVASVRRMNNYSLLEDNPESPYFGVVKVKSFVKRNDVLVGKYNKISKDGTRQEN